jgi:hypothetical protein
MKDNNFYNEVFNITASIEHEKLKVQEFEIRAEYNIKKLENELLKLINDFTKEAGNEKGD